METEDSPPKLIEKAISKLRELEMLVTPLDETQWNDLWDKMNLLELPEDWLTDLTDFVHLVRRWLDALLLPVDQLVLTVSGDIFREANDIALGYKIASLLKGIANANPSWRLTQFVEELKVISQNERKFIGFDDSETGYEPPVGKVTIATLHAAKGLEWDRVYLMAVNNYSFPSAMPQDEYIGEKWFVREDLNLDTEALAQLDALTEGWWRQYSIGVASEQARLDYAAERLRLLYVGITRAKQDLIILWNTGRYWDKGGNAVKQPALPLFHLKDYIDAQS
jgi:DNA helicase II / ATP-dependent DNA helicase PcrA